MTVQVLVTMRVEPCDPNDDSGSTGEFQDAAVQAVRHSLKMYESHGFCHALEEVVSMFVDEVILDERNEG